MHARTLRRVHEAFLQQAENACAAFAAVALAKDCVGPHRNNREWCVVYVYDAWARFCRSLILESAYAAPTTISGALVSAVVPSESAALSVVRKGFGRGGSIWEPQWASPGDAIQAAMFLGVANRGQVSASLGASPNPAEDIRLVRNFIAHRNRRTALDLRALRSRLRTPAGHEVDSLLVMPSLPYQSVFERWVRELTAVATAASR